MPDPIEDFTTEIKKEDISRLFINKKEFDFINKVASEFLQRVAGQFVYYLKINREKTTANIYGESKQKVMYDKVKLPATVAEIVKPINDTFGVRFEKELRVAFLQNLNIVYGVNDIVTGDYLEWQMKHYEVINVERDKKIYGQEEFVFELICNCKARE